MGSKNTPKPPDYTGAAREQAAASADINREQTWANRPNQQTPWGSVDWQASQGVDPATGKKVNQWTQNLNLTPELQAALDAQQRVQMGRSGLAESLLGRAGQEFGPLVDFKNYQNMGKVPTARDFDTSGLPGMQDPTAIRKQGSDTAYNEMTSRLDPRFQEEQMVMETKLRNQGLRPGDEAYDRAMGNFSRGKNDAYSQAMRQSFLTGGSEADRLYGQNMGQRQQGVQEMLQTGQAGFGQEMQQSAYANTLRQQQISEEMQRRGYSLNEINAILTGQQVGTPQMPNFMGAGKSETPQYMQAAQNQYGAQLDQFNADQAMWQGLMGGASQLGSAYLMGG